jgi:hypothetical protein
MNTTPQLASVGDQPCRVVPTSLRIIRRLHLYLGIALVPWFIAYSLSAFVFNHGQMVGEWFKSDKPDWTQLYEREYHVPVAQGDDLQKIAPRILQDFDLAGRSCYIYWNGEGRVNVTAFAFFTSTRLTYFVDQGRVVAEKQGFRLDRFLVGLHSRAGFSQRPWLTKAWGVTVDLVGLAVLTWAISGVYLWWKTHRQHRGGALVLAAGVACFVVLVAVL